MNREALTQEGMGASRNHSHKRRAKLGRAVAGVALGLVLASTAQADLFWDRDGATAGGSNNTSGAGIWGTDNFWSPSSLGDAATGPWVSDENAFFSAGTDVTGTFTITVNGAQTVGDITVQEGVITFTGGELILNGGDFTNTTNVTLNSILSGTAGLNKFGAGNLTLNSANTYSGATLIDVGRVFISNNNALGTSTEGTTFRPSAGGAAGAPVAVGFLSLTNNITIAEAITITNGLGNTQPQGQLDNVSGDNVITGEIIINGTSQNLGAGIPTIGAQAGTLTITGAVVTGTTSNSGWAKVGPGTLILSGDAPNTYGGFTRLFGGKLIGEKDRAFGNGTAQFTNGTFFFATSPYIQGMGLRAPASSPGGFIYSANEVVSIAGWADDQAGEGLWHNYSGHNEFAGAVQMANVQQVVPSVFIVPNPVGASANSSMVIHGPLSNSSTTSPRLFDKVGAGTIILTGSNTNAGPMVVSNGTLVFRSKADGNGGNWTPVSSVTFPSSMLVSPNGSMQFDNTVAVNGDRFFGSMPLNVDGGNFTLIGNENTDMNQNSVSGTGINAFGDASFTVTNPGTLFTTALTNIAGPSINRMNRSTMLFRGTALGTAATGVSQIFLDPSLNVNAGEPGGTGTKVGILPFATGDASGTAAGATGFVTYDLNGVRHLDEATEYAPLIVSGSTDLVNASISAPATIAANTTVNSIRMAPTSAIIIGDTATLSVSSGAILNTNTDPTSIRDGTLNFGVAEGVITTNGDLNISSVITGSNGVTKSGRGTLTLSADNTFSGPLTISGGGVAFSTNNQLGPAPAGPTAGTIVLNGGYLKPQGSMTLAPERGVTLTSQYTGFDIAANDTFDVASSIDGSGALTKTGAGTLVLSNANNTYTGGTVLKEGVLSIASNAQLGGPGSHLKFAGGTLRATGSTSISDRAIHLTGTNGTFDVVAGETLTSEAYIVGQGSLIKTGPGTLAMNAVTAPAALQNTFIGNVQINEGTLAYTSVNGLGYNPPVVRSDYWVIRNGATLSARYSSAGTAGISAGTRGITIENAANLDTADGILWNYTSVITGTGTLTKTGGGELRLGTANTYNGKTTVTGGGVLAINADNRLGAVVSAADSLTIDGSTFGTFSPATGATTFTLNAGRGITITPNNATIRAATNTTMTIAGIISGAGSLTKTDPGTIIMSGANTYTGPTTIEAGLLRVNGTNSGGGAVTIRNGATLGGTGTILSDVISESGGRINPGTTVGTLTMNGLSFDSSQFDVDGNATGFDRMNITGLDKFTLIGTSNVNVIDLGGALPGEYVIIDYAGAPLADISGLTLSNTTLGAFSLALAHDTANTQVKLMVGAGGPPQWNVDNDGSWGVGTNWSTFTQPNGPTDIANFLGKITAPRTVTLDTDKTVNAMNFDNVNTYTIAPTGTERITVTGGGAAITASQGTHVISAPVVLTDSTTIEPRAGSTLRLEGGLAINAATTVSKRGGGVLAIGGATSVGSGAALQAAEGSINLNSDAGTPASAASAAVANLALNVGAGSGAASVVLGSHQQLRELVVSHADADLQGLDLASPAVAGAYNGVRVYAADLDAAKSAIWESILNARTTAGDGIYDSGLHSGSGVGVAIITDEHGDRAVGLRSTRTGDLNLDGSVTIADFIDLASNFNTIGIATWEEGDLNYDRSVTIADFIDLAANFNGSYSGTIGAEDYQLLASFASSIGVDSSVIGSAVPEPATLSMLAVGALGLMSRRRRK